MTVNISANIEEDLAKKLEEVSKHEGRTKSYYIKKGLSLILDPKFQDIEDIMSAKKTLNDAKKSEEKFVSFDEVFKDVE